MSNATFEIRNNLYAFYDQLAQCKGIYAEKQDKWSVIRNTPGAWPGIIYRVAEDLPEYESSAELFDKVGSGHYPEVLIATDDNIRQTDPYLRARGFYPYMGWKGMARAYDDQWQVPVMPLDLELVSLEREQDKKQWVKIVSSELIAPTLFDQALIESLSARPGVQLFLLKANGVGVSTILTFDSGNSTGLYMIATDRPAQRKGFANVLVQQTVGQITRQSKKPLILHATPKGEGLYAKAGFLPYNQFFLYRFIKPKP